MKLVDPRCFFSASRCITSTSAELFTCVVSTLAQSCLQHFSLCWMNSVDSIQAEFSRGLLSQSVSICPEWCCPHPHGFARLCRAFIRLDQFPFVVMYLCLSQLILSRQAHSFCPRSSALSLHHLIHSAVQKKSRNEKIRKNEQRAF